MPELPEVETIRKQLDGVLRDKKIREVLVLRDKSFSGTPKDLLGKIIGEVGRKSKIIEFKFKNWEKMVIIHLKMTGQLIYVNGNKRLAGGHPTADWISDLPSSHTRVIVEFFDESKLFFNDMRVFGWMKVVDRKWYEKEVRKKVPDVIDKEFDFDYLKRVVSKSGRAIKLILTDQDKMGGIGNIYANEALYLAKIHPATRGNVLKDKEIERLKRSIIKVINKGIKFGGSSASDEKFVDTYGDKGKYQEHFMVYEMAGELCLKDGEIIKRVKIGEEVRTIVLNVKNIYDE